MSDSIREQIAAALEELLRAAGIEDVEGNAASLEIDRDSDMAHYPALVVMSGPETGSEENQGQLDLTMKVSVFGFVQVRGGDGENTGRRVRRAVNELYGKVRKAVLGGTRQLGGLAHIVRFVSMTPDVGLDASTRTGSFEAVFEVDYWTAAADPSSQT